MARATDPDSAGSQFFIVTSDNNTEALDKTIYRVWRSYRRNGCCT